MEMKIRGALVNYRPLRQTANVEFRFHATPLYNSIYLADDQLLVNMHVFGLPAAKAPVWHLRKVAGGELASIFQESFDRVWETGIPVHGGLMARRIDYYDDPNAPEANSLVPSVNVVVVDDQSRVLMIRRTDNDNWAVPGGAIDLGESVTQAAIRETKEESGIDCRITGLVGIYSDPKHVLHYTSNDEVRQEFSILLTAIPTGGELRPSSESSEVHWIDRTKIVDLMMDRSMRLRVEDFLTRPSVSPHLD